MQEIPPNSLVPLDHPARKMTLDELNQAISEISERYGATGLAAEQARLVNERAIYEAWRAERFPKSREGL
jgi:hypothetical protein